MQVGRSTSRAAETAFTIFRAARSRSAARRLFRTTTTKAEPAFNFGNGTIEVVGSTLIRPSMPRWSTAPRRRSTRKPRCGLVRHALRQRCADQGWRRRIRRSRAPTPTRRHDGLGRHPARHHDQPARQHPQQRQGRVQSDHRRHLRRRHVGHGSLTKSGAGTLTLSGANTYTGGTTVSAGTLLAAPRQPARQHHQQRPVVFDQAQPAPTPA